MSGIDSELIAGNISGDFSRNKDLPLLSAKFKLGVLLHRHIDEFTDSHKLVKEVQTYFVADYRHYSWVISDIIFDYFLAKNWSHHSKLSLNEFSKLVYESIEKHKSQIPTRFQKVYPYMRRDNWLITYQSIEGIAAILKRMEKRSKHFPDTQKAIYILQENEALIQTKFDVFFEELKASCTQFIESNLEE